MTDNLPTILTEISAIEAEMPDRNSDYWRSPDKQSRLRRLYEQRAVGPEESGSGSTILMPIMSQREYSDQAGTTDGYDAYLKVSRYAGDVLMRVPDAEAPVFVQSFEALSDNIAGAALGELMRERPWVAAASEGAVATFKTTPEGAALSAEWGYSTAKNLATVRERLWRIVDALDEYDVGEFTRWLDGLSAASTVAIYRKMAA